MFFCVLKLTNPHTPSLKKRMGGRETKEKNTLFKREQGEFRHFLSLSKKLF